MSVPLAGYSNIPRCINFLSSQLTWESAQCAANVAEAGFYGILKGGVQKTGKLVTWIRETSIAHIQTIQILFNLASGAIILFSTKILVEAIQDKFSYTVIDKSAGFWSTQSIPVVLAIGAAAALAVLLIRRLAPPPEHTKTVGQVNISESMRFQQKVAQVLHTTKLVLSVALICFEKKRLWLAISAATTGYSLWENMQLKWMTFSRSVPCRSHNPQVPITRLKADYNVLALPPVASAADEKCVICQDDSKAVDMAFCANHVFHQECVAGLAQSKSDAFLNNPKIIKRKTDHYQDGIYIRTSYDYSVTVSQNNFPSCPTCRDIPLQNDCQIEVTDQLHGTFNAAVTIDRPPVDRQYIFENLYAIYNVAQAGLTYLQTYPELTGAIFKIQKVMMPIDLAAYGLTAYYLYKKVNEKFNPQDSTAFKVASVAALAVAAVVSYFAVLQLNTYLRSAVVLKDMLAQMGISPDILSTIGVIWNAPLSHQLMQVLYINRIVAMAGLTFFSEQRKTNLLSTAAMLGSFTGISNLKWIEFTQALELPLQKVLASGGTLLGYLNENSLKSLKITSHFLVPSACVSNANHLKSSLQSIHTYASNLLNKSTWDRYWFKTYYHGAELSRRLYYNITLQNTPLNPFAATLGECTINAIDATFGAAKTVIKHAI